MNSELRNRATRRHESDSAVVEQNKAERTDSEVENLKDELAEKVEAWRGKAKKVRLRSSACSTCKDPELRCREKSDSTGNAGSCFLWGSYVRHSSQDAVFIH